MQNRYWVITIIALLFLEIVVIWDNTINTSDVVFQIQWVVPQIDILSYFSVFPPYNFIVISSGQQFWHWWFLHPISQLIVPDHNLEIPANPITKSSSMGLRAVCLSKITFNPQSISENAPGRNFLHNASAASSNLDLSCK